MMVVKLLIIVAESIKEFQIKQNILTICYLDIIIYKLDHLDGLTFWFITPRKNDS